MNLDGGKANVINVIANSARGTQSRRYVSLIKSKSISSHGNSCYAAVFDDKLRHKQRSDLN